MKRRKTNKETIREIKEEEKGVREEERKRLARLTVPEAVPL